MLTFPSALRIYLAVEPVDMRKQFNGLRSLAEEKFQENPRSGAVFVFINKDRDRIKMLYWDGTGVVVCQATRKRPVHLAGGQRPHQVVVGAGGAHDIAGGDRLKSRLQKSVV